MNLDLLIKELSFRTSRSGGAGGQNVNKVETRVEVMLDIPNSYLLSDEEKVILLSKLNSKLSSEGVLRLVSQTERSQSGNKEKVLEKFRLLIEKALTPQKPRKATKISRAAKEKRLATKKRDSEIKQLRRKDF